MRAHSEYEFYPSQTRNIFLTSGGIPNNLRRSQRSSFELFICFDWLEKNELVSKDTLGKRRLKG